MADPKIGEVLGCETYGPCSLEEHHPDLFWYGIHGVEALFTVMGTGCQSVSRVRTEGGEFVTGTWSKGRIGTFRGLRGQAGLWRIDLRFQRHHVAQGYGGYEPLLVEIAKFYRTGKPPVSAEETLEIFAFMEAADESKRQGGAPVALKTVLDQARKQASPNR